MERWVMEWEVTQLCCKLARFLSSVSLGRYIFLLLSITICIVMAHLSLGNGVGPH